MHLGADGKVVVVDVVEDWSDEEATDPKLVAKETGFGGFAEAAKLVEELSRRTNTVLVFAKGDTPLGKLFELRRAVKVPVLSWYVFAE